MIVKYNGSVRVAAGFRSVEFKALATKISDKRVSIDEILEIDGEVVSRSMSRTGSSRQSYNGEYLASLQFGKKKNISSLEVVND